MRRPILTASLLVASSGLLTACDLFSDKPEEAAIDESNVSGEVLEGTISDAMLPLDQLQSAAPQASAEPETRASDAATSDSASDDTAEPEEETVTVETFEEAFAPVEGEAANQAD